MSAAQTQDRIVQNLIRSAPIELKADLPTRHHDNGPAFAFYMLGCKECKTNWIRLTFVEGQEEKWETDAQDKLVQHLAQFHKDEDA